MTDNINLREMSKEISDLEAAFNFFKQHSAMKKNPRMKFDRGCCITSYYLGISGEKHTIVNTADKFGLSTSLTRSILYKYIVHLSIMSRSIEYRRSLAQSKHP